MAAKERTTAAIATAALLAALTGCVASPPASPTPDANTPSAAPAPSTPSPAELDLRRAEDAVVRLWATYDRIAVDPKASPGDMITVATGQLATKLQANLNRYRAQDLTAKGETVVEDPAARATGVTSDGLESWAVSACIDGTDFDLVDKNGESVIGPPYRVQHESTVILRDEKFLVAEDEATETC